MCLSFCSPLANGGNRSAITSTSKGAKLVVLLIPMRCVSFPELVFTRYNIFMNVIVIACNGLHLGFLGAYGNPWIETPHLDRLAAEGMVFDHHFAENLTTLPTRRSWWTGRYGFHDPDSGWTALRHDETILPDLLWNQGVRSALISDVPLLREAGQDDLEDDHEDHRHRPLPE